MLETREPERIASVDEASPPSGPTPCEWNRRVGWLSTCLGAISGSIMGLWSFDGPLPVPGWLGEYDHTSRRLARLGHIAFFGLGILNVLVARELRWSGFGHWSRRTAAWAMNFGNVFLPLTLFAAAAYRPLKFAMGAPVFAILLALVLTAYAVCFTKTSPVGGRRSHDETA
jgi:hypothetical protein